ncbi:MAG: M48 family metallopeptidase [Chromatiales bacterium]
MSAFTFVFLAALVANVALQVWLDQRHLRHIRSHRSAVPEPFAALIPLAAHQKAADYTTARVRLGVVESLLGAVVLLAWTLGGGFDLLDAGLRSLGWSETATGVAFLISAVLLMAIIDLPARLYGTFVIEQRFGFNRTTPRLFVLDLLKGGLLLLILGTPLAAVVLWLMRHAGELWWLYVWLTWTAFSVFMLWAFPIFIAPLFNKFEPLADRSLAGRIEGLLERTGFRSNGIYVMDGSRRSAHGNAYFTGFGTNKRIVFFDTLLKDLEAEEIEAVLAHELGHFKGRHVIKRITIMTVVSLLGLGILGWLSGQPWFYSGLGVLRPSAHTALILFLTVVPVFTFVLQPAMSWWSRRHEFEADEYAVRQADGHALTQALVKLYKGNASTLTPDPLYSAYHDSHPPAPQRVAQLQALMR